MEETISFLNEVFSKPNSIAWEYGDYRGVTEVSDQTVFVTNSCTLTYSRCMQYNIDMETLKRGTGDLESKLIALESIDPLTIQIDEVRGYKNTLSTPLIFQVTFSQPATREIQAVNITTGYFADKDTAQRAAKAYIHAIVLCHKPKAPSIL